MKYTLGHISAMWRQDEAGGGGAGNFKYIKCKRNNKGDTAQTGGRKIR